MFFCFALFFFANLAQKQDWDDNNHIRSRRETLYVTEFECSNEHLPEASNFECSHPHLFFRNFQRSLKWSFLLDGKRIFICWWFKEKRVCEGTACKWIFNIVLLSKVANGTAGIAAPKKTKSSTARRCEPKAKVRDHRTLDEQLFLWSFAYLHALPDPTVAPIVCQNWCTKKDRQSEFVIENWLPEAKKSLLCGKSDPTVAPMFFF